MKETNEWYQIELDTTKYTPVCAFTFHVPGGMSRSHSTETYVEYVPDPADPENTIYDIALYINNIDCDLRNSMVKWRLYKNNSSTPLSEGTMSPTFDTMKNNRLVLTNTQESLTSSTDEYIFLLCNF